MATLTSRFLRLEVVKLKFVGLSSRRPESVDQASKKAGERKTYEPCPSGDVTHKNIFSALSRKAQSSLRGRAARLSGGSSISCEMMQKFEGTSGRAVRASAT